MSSVASATCSSANQTKRRCLQEIEERGLTNMLLRSVIGEAQPSPSCGSAIPQDSTVQRQSCSRHVATPSVPSWTLDISCHCLHGCDANGVQVGVVGGTCRKEGCGLTRWHLGT